jgi:EAL and modified HD-GYP domain-containing signal transduction protein
MAALPRLRQRVQPADGVRTCCPENELFDLPPHSTDDLPGEDATPDPVALDSLALRWQLLVGRDRRPSGVRLELRNRGRTHPVPLSALLDSVVRGFVADESLPFPHGLVLLAPLDGAVDAAMARWSAPRNVLLEIPAADLQDEARVRILFDSRQQGVRQALRLHDALPARERLPFFKYLVGPSSLVNQATIPVLALGATTLAEADAALTAGAHGVIGWPICDPMEGKARELSPSQRAIFELVRLIQADAEIRALEKVFEAEPLLAYMLLTLANSVAFRRGTPTASLRHAVTSIGYQRLIKWLVLILAISSKEGRIAPLIFTTLVRGYCMENLCLASGRPRAEADEAFIVGAFSLLDKITGQPMSALLGEVGLPDAVVDALVARQGPFAPYLEVVLSLESDEPHAHDAACGACPADADAINRSLLQAIAAADAMLALI